MTQLEKALRIALEAHAGQKAKDGKPYILHPLRLMLKMDSEEEQIIAVLHDVIEDSDITFADLREQGLSERVIVTLKLLTRDTDVSYEDYVQRLKSNPLARKIKIADLEDNSDIRHLSGIEEKDIERLKKYHRAWQILHEPPAREG